MQYLYPFIISFIFIFFSELGDKTQILVLSFSAKNKATHILLGVALGTLLSHGLAIVFGSHISIITNANFVYYLKIFTYFTFILFGFWGFINLKKPSSVGDSSSKSSIIRFLSKVTKNCVIVVASTIAIGELGDKTFLASIGLGIEYPFFKLPLICGSICGMVASNSIAIFLGKWISTKVSTSAIEIFSNLIFILFGLIGLFTMGTELLVKFT